ncbi:MAG: VWA domain-containing protein, partial [Sinobacteraceae bacterium]|nr:VWA domain-containing protein [Nevskiaceae bacterium]
MTPEAVQRHNARRNSSLKRSLPSVCRALTRQKGIKLVFRGPPRTDGKTIYSNPLPLEADEDGTLVITGDLDHECGHILYTDFDTRNSIKQRVGKERVALVARIHNALEDTFIEWRLGREYMGCKQTLARSAELLYEQGKISTAGADTPALVLTQYVDAWGRVHVNGQKLDGLLDDVGQVMAGLLGDTRMSELDELLQDELSQARSTQDTLDLAFKVEQFIQDCQAPESPQQEAASEQGGEDSDKNPDAPGDGDNDDKSDEAKASGKSDQSKNSSESDESAASNNTGDTDESGHPQPSSSGQNGTGSDEKGNEPSPTATQAQRQQQRQQAAKAAQAILDDDSEDKPLVDRREAANEVIDGIIDQGGMLASDGGELYVNEDYLTYQRLREQTSGVARELQRRLVMQYQTVTRRRYRSTDYGRLDCRRLPRGVLGDPEIYRARVKQKLPYPAVSVVVDCSGSMEGCQMNLAKQCLVAVGEANRQIGVATELSVFAGQKTRVIKAFDRDLDTRVKGLVGGLHASGGTPTAKALWEAANRLVARREQRKLLIVVTDGLPNDLDDTQQVAAMITKSGIELYGVGIQCEGIHLFCSHAGVINDPQDITQAVM